MKVNFGNNFKLLKSNFFWKKNHKYFSIIRRKKNRTVFDECQNLIKAETPVRSVNIWNGTWLKRLDRGRAETDVSSLVDLASTQSEGKDFPLTSKLAKVRA